MIAAWLLAATINITVHAPWDCALAVDPAPRVIERWKAMKDGVQWKSRRGPWSGAIFTCAQVGIGRQALAGADYIRWVFDDGEEHIMCITGKNVLCPVPLVVEGK